MDISSFLKIHLRISTWKCNARYVYFYFVNGVNVCLLKKTKESQTYKFLQNTLSQHSHMVSLLVNSLLGLLYRARNFCYNVLLFYYWYWVHAELKGPKYWLSSKLISSKWENGKPSCNISYRRCHVGHEYWQLCLSYMYKCICQSTYWR